MVAHGEVCEAAAHLVNPPHRLAVHHEQQDGAVVDDDLVGVNPQVSSMAFATRIARRLATG